MCGIAAVIKNKERGSEELLKKMLQFTKHRGPDHSGWSGEGEFYYGMNRLSIIDLEGGDQPIFKDSPQGRFSIIFNGEIYNYKEIREQLQKEGYNFESKSDTEVVLNLFIKHKKNPEDFLMKLRGMFAFMIYDQEKESLFVARDFFGIKPLYYLKGDGDEILALASEAKALLLHPNYESRLNYGAVRNYLSFGYNPLKETFFKRIFKLDPGSFLKIDKKSGEFQEKKYFELSFLPDQNLEEKDSQRKTEKIMEESVKYHLVSDVPVGAFLSGGIDSSIITSLIRKIKPQGELHTFTIGGSHKNEFKRAREAARALGSRHHEIKLDPQKYFRELSKIIWHFDEPVADASAYALYFLSQKAREKVKVVLSGEGADELFGGYGIYKEPFAISKLSTLPAFLKTPILALKNLPFYFYGKNYLNRASLPLEKRYIGNSYIFKENEIKKIWKREKVPDFFDLSFYFSKSRHLPDSTRMQVLDMENWLVGDILAKGDKMSMANSLEVRVPFLDRVVGDFARTVPERLKYREGKTKYLLRKLVQKLLPQIRERKRQGFPIPLAQWMREERSWVETLEESQFLKEVFQTGVITTMVQEHLSLKKDNARKLFVLLVLALWHREFFEKK